MVKVPVIFEQCSLSIDWTESNSSSSSVDDVWSAEISFDEYRSTGIGLLK